jgi:hypothetical protein
MTQSRCAYDYVCKYRGADTACGIELRPLWHRHRLAGFGGQERIVAKRTLKPPRFPCRPHHSHAASGLDHAFNDRSAGMAKLMRKFAQA